MIKDPDTAMVGAAIVGVSLFDVINNWVIPFFGVPVTVLTMAAGGALVSFAHGKPEKDRRKLYKLAAANTFIATMLIAVAPKLMGWEWVTPENAPALAAITAWLCRWGIPSTISLMPELVRKLFKLGEYNNSSSMDSLQEKYYDEQTKD